MNLLCPMIDDSEREAQELAERLEDNGCPLEILPVTPAETTLLTRMLVLRAKPRAALVDFRLDAQPKVRSERLAAELVRKGVPTAILTKDRQIVDEGPRKVGRLFIPVFSKEELIDSADKVSELVKVLEVPSNTQPATSDFWEARLESLRDKSLSHKLTASEKEEIRKLEARMELFDAEEAHRIAKSQGATSESLDELIREIRELRKLL